jgi:hypothetical protein
VTSKRTLCSVLAVISLALLTASPLSAWNDTGHKLVGAIAWDHMTPVARQRTIALLQAAPADACLLDRFPDDSRPLPVREREFFMIATTWADIVRPDREHPRPCDRFHRASWHFINYFWSGTSGASGADRPVDRPGSTVPTDNVVERLTSLRPIAACLAPPCSSSGERAVALAWILHLVGDLQEPLHTSSRVTTAPGEQNGDQGGNLFKLGPPDPLRAPPSLHGYWDGIIDRALPRLPNETDQAYLARAESAIVARHPLAQMKGRIQSGEFRSWSQEGFDTTKRELYPETLIREQMPADTYRSRALSVAEEAIALGGYRLADLLNAMFSG